MKPFGRTEFVGQLVPEWISPGKGSWLDACCGSVCPTYIPIAKKKKYKLITCSFNVRDRDRVKFTDLQMYDPRLGTYDLITSTDTLEHIADYMSALRNLRRYCKQYMILAIPRGRKNGHAKLDPEQGRYGHEWRFCSAQLLNDLRATGWQVCGEYFTYSRPINCIGHVFFCVPKRGKE